MYLSLWHNGRCMVRLTLVMRTNISGRESEREREVVQQEWGRNDKGTERVVGIRGWRGGDGKEKGVVIR